MHGMYLKYNVEQSKLNTRTTLFLSHVVLLCQERLHSRCMFWSANLSFLKSIGILQLDYSWTQF